VFTLKGIVIDIMDKIRVRDYDFNYRTIQKQKYKYSVNILALHNSYNIRFPDEYYFQKSL